MKGTWITALAAVASIASAADVPPPRELTAEQDHQLMMDRLGITEIRRGADGRDPNSPNAANYDEAKGNPYPELPAVLMFDNGKPVKNARDWTKRRAEIGRASCRERV